MVESLSGSVMSSEPKTSKDGSKRWVSIKVGDLILADWVGLVQKAGVVVGDMVEATYSTNTSSTGSMFHRLESIKKVKTAEKGLSKDRTIARMSALKSAVELLSNTNPPLEANTTEELTKTVLPLAERLEAWIYREEEPEPEPPEEVPL